MSAVPAPSQLPQVPPGPTATSPPLRNLDPLVPTSHLPEDGEPLPAAFECGAWYRLLLRGDERVHGAVAAHDRRVVSCVQRVIRSADAHRIIRDLHALTAFAYADRDVLYTLVDRVGETDPRLAHSLVRHGTSFLPAP